MSKLLKNKFGVHNISSKSSSGAAFDSRMQSIKAKDKSELTQKEQGYLDAEYAMRPSVKENPYKLGMYGVKKQTPHISNIEMSSIFNTQQTIPMSSFLNNQSSTGIMSNKDIMGGVNLFAQKLKQSEGVKYANPIMDVNNKIIGIDVGGNYMKTQLNFNPRTLSFTKKDWQLDIPDDYKLVNGKYVAPEVQYVSSYKKNDGKKRTSTSTYNPVEIYLDESGKITKVVEKDTYRTDYESRAGKKEYKQATYDKKIVDYFGDGRLKAINEWSPYDKEYESKNDRTEYIKGIFKRKDVSYTPKGVISGYTQWGTYKPEEYRRDDDKYDIREHKETPFINVEKEFDEYGRPVAVKQYSVFDKEYTDRGYSKKGGEDTYLRQQDYYVDGYKVGTAGFDKYVEYTNPSSRSVNVRQNTAQKYLTYYNPITGEIVESEVYW